MEKGGRDGVKGAGSGMVRHYQFVHIFRGERGKVGETDRGGSGGREACRQPRGRRSCWSGGKGTGESKEDEREESRVEEASSVDRRENCSGDGREERTDEARVEGERDFRLRREVTI